MDRIEARSHVYYNAIGFQPCVWSTSWSNSTTYTDFSTHAHQSFFHVLGCHCVSLRVTLGPLGHLRSSVLRSFLVSFFSVIFWVGAIQAKLQGRLLLDGEPSAWINWGSVPEHSTPSGFRMGLYWNGHRWSKRLLAACPSRASEVLQAMYGCRKEHLVHSPAD